MVGRVINIHYTSSVSPVGPRISNLSVSIDSAEKYVDNIVAQTRMDKKSIKQKGSKKDDGYDMVNNTVKN